MKKILFPILFIFVVGVLFCFSVQEAWADVYLECETGGGTARHILKPTGQCSDVESFCNNLCIDSGYSTGGYSVYCLTILTCNTLASCSSNCTIGGTSYKFCRTGCLEVDSNTYVSCMCYTFTPLTVTTDIATVDIQNNQATLKGNVTDTGGENPSKRVLEWGTSSGSYPNNHDCGSGGTGEFSYTISLNPGTIYYYRAKAYNSGGWGYGGEKQVVIYLASGGQQSFITPSPAAPTIAFQPTTFSFGATEGGSNPTNQTLEIWNSGSGTLDWSVSDNAAWLTLSPVSGVSTGEQDSVILSVNIWGGTAGTYSATITISDPNATNSPQTASVSLNITAAPNNPPTCNYLSASPSSGGAPLNVSFTGSGSDSDGTIAQYEFDFGDGSSKVYSSTAGTTHTYNTVGTYCAKLRVKDDDGAWSTNTGNCPGGTCTQTITVTGDGSIISFSPSSFTFSATEGGSNPANQTLEIWNSGSGTLDWSVSDNAAWLTLSPASGSSTGEHDNVTLSVNISGRTAGTYSATITITDPNATNSPQTVPVSLNITAVPKPTISFSPSSFTFSATEGGSNPANQTLEIWNSGSGTLNWSVSDNATWLSLSPASGSSTGEQDSVILSVNTSGMTVGTYTATITISASGATNTPQTLTVNLTIQSGCARANPPVQLYPDSYDGNPGVGFRYYVSVYNYDSDECGSSDFTLSYSCPSGWSCSLDTNSLTISAGGKAGGTYLNVIPPSGAVSSQVSATVLNQTAQNNGEGTYSGSDSSYYNIIGCTGNISLTLTPPTVAPSGSVTPSASGLFTSGCEGKTIRFRQNSCSGTQVTSCAIPSGGSGCIGSNFTAPASAGQYTYFACIDKDNDGNYTDAGESDSGILNVTVASCTEGGVCANPGEVCCANNKLYTCQQSNPTTVFYSTPSDGYLWAMSSYGYVYVHHQYDGIVDDDLTSIRLGQYGSGGFFELYRAALFFDTSSLAEDANITAATISIYGSGDDSSTDFNITLVSGAELDDPLVSSDYYPDLYLATESRGTLSTVSFKTNGYNNISFNSAGISEISKTGTTKFGLRSSRDINYYEPWTTERISFYANEIADSNKKPKLSVTYTGTPAWKYTQDCTYGCCDADNNSCDPCLPPVSCQCCPDTTPPTTTISPNGRAWGNADANFNLTCNDGTGSGCQTTEYKIIDQSQICDTTDLTAGYSGTVSCASSQTCQKKVCFRSTDNAGNPEAIKTSNLFKIDKEKPTSVYIFPTPPAGSDVTADFTLYVDDSDGTGSGFTADSCRYTVYDSGVGATPTKQATRTCDGSFTITVGEGKDCRTDGGTCTVIVYAIDKVGNQGDGSARSYNIRVDLISPTITINTLSGKWYNSNPLLDVDFVDDKALDDGFYQVDSYSGGTTDISQFGFTQVVENSLPTYAEGWASAACSGTYNYNCIAGYTRTKCTGTYVAGAGDPHGCCNGCICVNVGCQLSGGWTAIFTDNTGISYTTDFRIADATWNGFADGSSHTIYFKATDDATNQTGQDGSKSLVIKKDVSVSTTTISPDGKDWGNADVGFTLTCTDNPLEIPNSGCDITQYKIIDSGLTCDTTGLTTGTSGTVTCPAGEVCQKKVCFRSIDNAGNSEAIKTSDVFRIDKTKPVSQITAPPVGSTQTTDFNISVSDTDTGGSGIKTDACYYYVYDSGVGQTRNSTLRTCNSNQLITVGSGKDCQTDGGICTVYVYSYDNAGNLSDTNSRGFIIKSADTTPPTVWVTGAPTNWQNTDAQASVGCDDGGEGSGCDTTSYRLKTYTSNPGTCPTNYADYNLTPPQIISSRQWLCAAAEDWAGNVGFCGTEQGCPVQFKVDKNLPQVAAFDIQPRTLNIANPTGTFTWTVTDSGGSTLDHVEIWRANYNPTNCSDTDKSGCVWDQIGPNYNAPSYASSWTVAPGAKITDSPPDGIYWYGLHVFDKADNMGIEPSPIKVTVDKIAPSTTISPDGKDWGNSDVDFTLSCDDGTGSGCQTTQYKVIEQSQTCDIAGLITGTSGTVTCPVAQTCQKKVCFRSIDNLDNEESINTSNLFKIDKESPLVGVISPTACQINVSTSFSANVSDNIEVTNCWLYVEEVNDGEMSLSVSPCQSCAASKNHTFTSTGDYSLYVFCKDQANNYTFGPAVTVTVTEFAPLICDINVPGTGIINQWISINVSGSQGAIVGVRFTSNEVDEPFGAWDPSPPNYYGWNTPEGDWEDATSKIMKWSFAEAGNYEAWAEISDGDGIDTVSCSDTIKIMECWPDLETRPCWSTYGCEHTQTCTSEGTWPLICGPTDECSLGGEPQTCWVDGTEGLQTCTDICIWGTCIFPPPPNGNGVECPWPPDNPPCEICQHPVCNVETNYEWVCDFDPAAAGTDCGDCLMCDSSGNCNIPLCSGTPESCECIPDAPDSCKDCNNYGTQCGYNEGPCYCGPYEYPIWSCDEGKCQCDCQEDETGTICPREPPEGCEYNPPIVGISPDYREGAAGDRLTYTVSVINQDEGVECESSNFTLSTSGICDSWDCDLDLEPSILTIAPQCSQTTQLYVESPSEPLASKGYYTISVNAVNQTSGLFGTGYTTYEVLNNPPSATGLSATPIGDCFLYHPYVKLEWSFSDPDLASGDYQSAREVEIFSDSGYTNLVNSIPEPDYSPGSTEYTPNTGLSFNTDYYWRVRVWDNEGTLSDCGQPEGWCYPEELSFRTEKEWPWPDFSVTPPTQRVHLKEKVEFTDESTCYDGPCNLSPTATYLWEFGDGGTSLEKSTSHIYLATGNYDVTLTIIDEVGNCTSDPIEITVTLPLPEWMEIPPF